jgi:hypothetical protein
MNAKTLMIQGKGLHLEAEDAIDRDADELEPTFDLERIKSCLTD